MSISEAVLDFRVAPLPHLSRIVRERVIEFARFHAIGEDDLAYFLTALGEAVANAIEHALADQPILIEVKIDDECIVATVQDNGIGFACEKLVEPNLPEIHAERGRGLPIMRRCSDIFDVRSEPGCGTAVVVGRYLQTPSRRAADA
jgi:anti-sigma regulatory factor (Ser/Thr protein kinase)